LDIARAGIRACDARELTRRALDRRLGAGGFRVPRHLVAAGKAAATMAAAVTAHPAADVLGGVVVGPTSAPELPPRLEVFVGGHPVPSEGSERGGRRVLELATSSKIVPPPKLPPAVVVPKRLPLPSKISGA